MKIRMRSTADTARSHLKAQTDDLHQRLHALSVFERLLDGSLAISDYARMMDCFRNFYVKLDSIVVLASEAGRNELRGYSYQPRAPMFSADVAALDGEFRAIEPQHRPNFSLPEVNTIASLAGVVYVIDGSVLGGMTMNMAAKKLLPTAGTKGRTYWDWCRKHGSAQWKSALTLVDDCWRVEQNRRSMTSSAVQTFSALNDAMKPMGKLVPAFAA